MRIQSYTASPARRMFARTVVRDPIESLSGGMSDARAVGNGDVCTTVAIGMTRVVPVSLMTGFPKG